MMRIDKIELAGQLLIEAARDCLAAQNHINYAKSILLSGAVISIVTPYLRHLQLGTLHGELAGFAADLEEVPCHKRLKAIGDGVNFYRDVYNSLKHSGGAGRTLEGDRHLEADLKAEAYHLVDCAISDFNRLFSHDEFKSTPISPELRLLVGSPWLTPNKKA